MNVSILPAAASAKAALTVAEWALEVEDDVWMPIHAEDRNYPPRSFPRDRLIGRWFTDAAVATENRILTDGHLFVGREILSTFEPAVRELSWHLEGDLVRVAERAHPVCSAGVGFLSSLPAGPAATGTAHSGEFVAEPGDALLLFLAGSRGLGLKVLLCADGEPARSLLPETGPEPVLTPAWCDLEGLAGRALSLRVADEGDGWLAIDQLMLVRAVASERAAMSLAWSKSAQPKDWEAVGRIVAIEPLPSIGGMATSGSMTVTLVNPLSSPVRLTLELVHGPAGTEFGYEAPDRPPDGVDGVRVAPASIVNLQARLHVPERIRVDLQRFILRVRVFGAEPRANSAPVFSLEVPLRWRERD